MPERRHAEKINKAFCAQRRTPTVGKTNATHWTQTPTFSASWEKSRMKSKQRQGLMHRNMNAYRKTAAQ
jgi:hypothetical protein